MTPAVAVADAEALPFEDETFDVVYSNGVLHHTPRLDQAVAEAYRVLRPGGSMYLTVYNRHSIFYLVTLGLFDQVLQGGWRHRSLAERLAMIEHTTSDAKPLVRVYTRGEVRRHLEDAGFDSVATKVRKLVREDLTRVATYAVRRNSIPAIRSA